MIEVFWILGGMLFLLGAAMQSWVLATLGSAMLVAVFWIATRT